MGSEAPKGSAAQCWRPETRRLVATGSEAPLLGVFHMPPGKLASVGVFHMRPADDVDG